MTPDRSNNEHLFRHDRVFPMIPNGSGLHEVPAGGLQGVCPLCNQASTFQGFTANERESGVCSNCGSINRQRQMAAMLRGVYGLKDELGKSFNENFSIYNTESTGPLHAELVKLPAYIYSEYFGDEFKSGAVVNGIRHEDLQNLSLHDESIDLVLSSDVLEHMPRPYDAHREIFRVLKPGGHHIFTVPFYPWEALDEVRAAQNGSDIKYFGEKLYHGDPIRPDQGVLVWHIFGLQMVVEMARIGFVMSYWNLHQPSQGIIGPWNIMFDAYKPLPVRR